MSELDTAVGIAEKLKKQLVQLVEETKKLPVINATVVEWLATEKKDEKAVSLLNQYNGLVKKYEALAVSDENVVAANVWIGSRGAKVRASINKGADYLQTLAVEDKEVASHEVVSAVLDSVSKLKSLPNTKAAEAQSDDLAQKMRKWAQANDYDVSVKGRVPLKVIAAYALAHPDEIQ